ncbi:MAG: hypothetical protein ABS68_00025 [Niastella sp. SCN 39-18]|nr:rhodanese-like domain-containing protein [Sphingobacteriales bacterium]ODT55214.1 MAG: hypothetical protein ABS68_00025 [Niastella sp. SCN 39-18]OJW09148.1 MAG: hypothetical protein BGO53_00380 [Sphingobacteriales bacterium 39-19]
MQSINAQELHQRLKSGENILLIDVREPHERQWVHIGGILIPTKIILQYPNLVPKDRPVVFYCQKGIRSAITIQRLQEKYEYTNLLNLTGGIDAWQASFPNYPWDL